MHKLLLIVDPQIDFISGSLPVPHAREAMDSLAAYASDNINSYDACVVTLDWHPIGHCSFKENGGPWPMHCVRYSQGAAIYPPLYESLYAANPVILTKGDTADTEEYSIFDNHKSAKELKRLIAELNIAHIDICGLAGDVCVKKTLNDGVDIYGDEFFTLLTQFSPAISQSENQ